MEASYPEKLSRNRLRRLIEIEHPVCLCENIATTFLMGNEEEKLEKRFKNFIMEEKKFRK